MNLLWAARGKVLFVLLFSLVFMKFLSHSVSWAFVSNSSQNTFPLANKTMLMTNIQKLQSQFPVKISTHFEMYISISRSFSLQGSQNLLEFWFLLNTPKAFFI